MHAEHARRSAPKAKEVAQLEAGRGTANGSMSDAAAQQSVALQRQQSALPLLTPGELEHWASKGK